jgi:hypothetical protein
LVENIAAMNELMQYSLETGTGPLGTLHFLEKPPAGLIQII